jgi:O-antigen/teichoic acid export membrane protein
LGIVSKQAYSNTINIVVGFVAGAINTLIILPKAFENNLDDWGLLKLILSFALVLAPFFGMGVNNTIIMQFGGNKDPFYRRSVLGFSLLVSIFGALIATVFIFSHGLSLFTNARDTILINDNMMLFWVLSLSLILLQVFAGYIVASHKTPAIPFVNDVYLKISYLGLSLYYLINKFDFELFLKLYVGTYVGALLIYIFYAIYLDFKVSFNFKILQVKELLIYGLYTILDKGAAIIVANLDLIMIAYLLELSDVAIYGLAFFIAAVILIPQKAIMAPTLPIVSNAVKGDKSTELKKLYQQSSINLIIIGGALFILIWLNIDEVYSLLPNKFSDGKWVVFYIGLSRLFILSSGISGAIIVFSKYYRVNLIFNLFLVGLTIITNYFLITKYGMPGAAMATAITYGFYNLLKVIYINHRFKMQPFTIETFKSLLILIVVFFIGGFIVLFPEHPMLSIISKSIIISILMIIGFYGIKVKAEILEMPKKLLNRFKG